MFNYSIFPNFITTCLGLLPLRLVFELLDIFPQLLWLDDATKYRNKFILETGITQLIKLESVTL